MPEPSGIPAGSPTVINIGLLGLGVVGTGVAAKLYSSGSSLSNVTGRQVNLKKVLVRDFSRVRDIELPDGVLTTNAEDILADPDMHIMVEVMGGTDPAEDYLRRGLAAGKHVITANKEVMAKSGPDLMTLAHDNGVNLLFEASVGGGIPIVGCMMNELAANDIRSIRSIINGTTNYILTRMAYHHTDFQQALGEAQQRGYAEADPSGDVQGHDAAGKVVILANLLMDLPLTMEDVSCKGITGLTADHISEAAAVGERWKLIGRVEKTTSTDFTASVQPQRVSLNHPLASISGVTNAITYTTELLGEITLVGPGAGRIETGYALLEDMLAIHQNCSR